jgi:hypothetical protein
MLEKNVRQELGEKAEWHDWTYSADKHLLIATGTYRFTDPENPMPVVQRLGRLVRKLSDWRPDLYLWTNPAERDERHYVSEGDSRRTFQLVTGSFEPGIPPDTTTTRSQAAPGQSRTIPRHRSQLRRSPSAQPE